MMDVELSEFDKQIDDLLGKEKTARLNSDANESVKIFIQIAQVCFDAKQYNKFNELIVMLSKKRGQAKKSQIEVVQMAMKHLHSLELEPKLAMIDAIMKVCEKKIFLEVEYARCVLLLTRFKEDDNQIADAAKILQEVQVETYGSMDKREKLEFILYQMKIMMKKLDYVRLFIISKKIEPKNIEDDKIADLKITYYSYLVFYYRHESQYDETAHAYSKILETLHKHKELENTDVEFGFKVNFMNILENYVLYLAISPHCDSRTSQLKGVLEQYQYAIEQNASLKHLIKEYLGSELISTNINDYNVAAYEIFSNNIEHQDKRLKDLRKQLISHNLRVFQLYYESINLARISELINVGPKEIEEEISLMIDNKLLKCKIDRLTGVVQFQLRQNENEALAEWGGNINKVLDLIELTSNLIKREEEIYL